MERSEFIEKTSAQPPGIEREVQDFENQLCSSYDNALAEYRLTKASETLLKKTNQQRDDFLREFQNQGGSVSDESRPILLARKADGILETQYSTQLTIQSDCKGRPQTLEISENVHVDGASDNNENLKPNIGITNKPEESSPRVDELIHEALSIELQANHSQMDRKTRLFAADILDQAAKGPYDYSYVRYPAGHGQYRGLAKDLLKDPERAKEAVRVLNELVPGNMWSISENRNVGPIFTLRVADDARLTWNKDGDIIEGNYKNQNAKESWVQEHIFMQSEEERKAVQESVFAEASKKVHEALIMHRTPMMQRLEKPRDPNFKPLYHPDNYFKR